MSVTNTTTNNGMQRTMIAPVETIMPSSHFWSTYMGTGTRELLPTKFVEWDYFIKGSPSAHFVGDNSLYVPPTERGIFDTAQIETPKYQHRKALSLQDIANRTPGESYGALRDPSAFMTAQERAGRLEAEDEIECVNAIANLRERIFCEFLFDGRVTVAGYGVNRVINYDLPNKYQLLGGDRWGQSGVNPLDDIRGWCEHLEDHGFNAIEVIMDRNCWNVIENNEKWMKQLDIMRVEKGRFAPEKAAEYGNAAFMATLRDPFVNIYVQRSKYFDDATGTMKPHLPENTLIVITPESRRNRIVYGSIDYMEGGIIRTVSGEFIKETWHSDRDGTKEVVVTSRAVPIPANIHSWVVATVM